MLTIWCQAEIECDADPCKAPYEAKSGNGPRMMIDSVQRTRRAAVADVTKTVLRTGWIAQGGKWFCPWCKSGSADTKE